MKRIFILTAVFLMCTVCSLAQAQEVEEVAYCAVPKENETSLGAKLSNLTGINFLSTKAAELAIQNAIKTQLGSKTNIEIYPYSLGSLIQGKFKKMAIDSKNLNLSGISVSKFSASTVCNYNQVGVSDNNLLFKENFVMQFSGKITNEDLEKTMASDAFLNMVQSAKISAFGQVLFRLSYMKISIKNDKLILVANVMSPIFWGNEQKKISATSGLSVQNGKIKYKDLRITNSNLGKHVQALLSLVNLVNPFTFEVKLSKNTTGYTSVKNVIIDNNEINLDGVLYIPKNN